MIASPLFSILVAQYNNARFLQQAIDSVYAQEYANWEIIIVDDCSTDNSCEIYKEYEQDNRIHVFYNKENRGEGYTMSRRKLLLCQILTRRSILQAIYQFALLILQCSRRATTPTPL